jgi:hypothetical protein
LSITVGSGDSGAGGSITISSGEAVSAGTVGGDIAISAGHGVSNDAADGGNGGAITVDGGKASGANAADAGGTITITGGAAAGGNGGDVIIRSGPSSAGASFGGDVIIRDGGDAQRWVSDEHQIKMTSANTLDAWSVGNMNLKTTGGYSPINIAAHWDTSGNGLITTENSMVMHTEDGVAGAVTDMITVKHSYNGISANACSPNCPTEDNFGAGFSWYLENAGNVLGESARLEVVLSTVASGSENSKYIFKTRSAGTIQESASLDHSGLLTLKNGLYVQAGGISLQGAQTVTTTTADLTLATGAGNGNVKVTPHGTGKMLVMAPGATVTPLTNLHVSASDATMGALDTSAVFAVEKNADAGMTIISPNANSGTYWFSSPQMATDGFVSLNHKIDNDASQYQYMSFGVGGYNTDTATVLTATEKMRISNDGYVGIGMLRSDGLGGTTTDAPITSLHVKNDDEAAMSALDKSNHLLALFEKADAMVQVAGKDDGTHVSSLVLTSKPASGNQKHWVHMQHGPDDQNMPNGYSISYHDSTDVLKADGLNTAASGTANFLNIKKDGKVGIGTAAPAFKLQVAGSLDATSISLNGVAIGTSSDSFWSSPNDDGSGAISYASGHVGIGMGTPSQVLHIKDTGMTTLLIEGGGVANSQAGIQLDPNGVGNSFVRYDNALEFTANATGTVRAILTQAGNLGVSTISPIAKVHIKTEDTGVEPAASAISTNGHLLVQGATGSLELMSRDTDSAVAHDIGMGRYKSTDGTLISKMGIITVADTGSQNSNLLNRLSFTYGVAATVSDTSGNNGANAELVSITRDGKVGVGLTAPPATIATNHDVFLASSNTAWPTNALWPAAQAKGLYMRYSTFGTQDGAYIQSRDRTTSDSDPTYHPMYLQASHIVIGGGSTKVGIGLSKDNINYEFHVSGQGMFTAGLVEASDARFKKEIITIGDGIRAQKAAEMLFDRGDGNSSDTSIDTDTPVLSQVRRIAGVYYKMRREEFPQFSFNGKQQVGVVAQDIEKVFPAVVSTDKDGYKSVAYTKLVPILLEAVKEQDVQETRLRGRVNKLEKELEAMRAAVCMVAPHAPGC